MMLAVLTRRCDPDYAPCGTGHWTQPEDFGTMLLGIAIVAILFLAFVYPHISNWMQTDRLRRGVDMVISVTPYVSPARGRKQYITNGIISVDRHKQNHLAEERERSAKAGMLFSEWFSHSAGFRRNNPFPEWADKQMN